MKLELVLVSNGVLVGDGVMIVGVVSVYNNACIKIILNTYQILV